MLRWQIPLQEYRGNMTIIYKKNKSHNNSDFLSRWPLENGKRNPAYHPEMEAQISIHSMEMDRRRNYSFAEREPASGTQDTDNIWTIKDRKTHKSEV
ncbi:hypothetical protein O181_031483 [Austropuccinia psidii MF-1]|uniref:Uncharacterized protein n=1 Tax=Austropuccinia psidii MF-1 TaxID=1389203 RepID=A0A9Q3H4M9_9BASI|nr:hypothetical protein [Austropuccinia psidii MF-1]